MEDGSLQITDFVDAAIEVIQKTNSGETNDAIKCLTRIQEKYAPHTPIPVACHPAIHALAECATYLGAANLFTDFLASAAYDADNDRAIRQDLNELCAEFSTTEDYTRLISLIEECVKRHIRPETLYPYADDVFKLFRTLANTLNAPEALRAIDGARFYTDCFKSLKLEKSDATGHVSVSGYGINEFSLYTKGDCPIAATVQRTGVYEPTSMQVWAGLTTDASIVVDVGAHVGFYSLLAAAVNPHVPVLGVEPNPDAYARLLENRQQNNFSNIQCHPIACTGESGRIAFEYLPSETKGQICEVGTTAGRTWSSGKSISVETRCIDDLIADLDVKNDPRVGTGQPLIKIDTEGEEGNVMQGARKTIQSSSPDFMIECFRADTCEQINETLRDHGYRFFHIIEGGHELVERDRMMPAFLESAKNYNTLLTKRPAAELEMLIKQPITLRLIKG